MKLFIMVGLVFLAGCSGYTNAKDIQIAIQACETNGGLAWVSNTPLTESVYSKIKCNNGFEIAINDYKRINGIDK